MKYPGAPYVFAKTQWRVGHPAPLLGEQNEEIYGDLLGQNKREIVKMREGGVI